MLVLEVLHLKFFFVSRSRELRNFKAENLNFGVIRSACPGWWLKVCWHFRWTVWLALFAEWQRLLLDFVNSVVQIRWIEERSVLLQHHNLWVVSLNQRRVPCDLCLPVMSIGDFRSWCGLRGPVVLHLVPLVPFPMVTAYAREYGFWRDVFNDWLGLSWLI
jgi:hypothetical protein